MRINKNVYKLINWFYNKPIISGIIVFIFLSITFTFIAFQQNKIYKESKRIEMSNILNVITLNIDQTLKNCYTTTLTLALTIDENGIPQNFDSIGKRLLESNNSINAVQMVPNGVIKYTYPLIGNEKAMGLDILNLKHLQKEALKSIQNKKMYFAGPLELEQGGLGIVGRLPVYLKNKFWGFSAVIIKLDRLLNTSGINSIDNKKYSFQISKKNPLTQKENYFLPEKIKLSNSNYVWRYIPDGDWKLYLIDKNAATIFNKFIFSIILGFFLACIFAFFTVLLLKKPAQLQLLIQEQANKLINIEIKFKTIFEQAALGIANFDRTSGKFIEINEKFCKLLGYSESEMKNKDFQSITHPDDLDADLEFVNKLTSGIIEQYSLEKRYITKNGKIIWVNLTVTPLFLNNNLKEFSFISIVEDITVRKRNEAKIKKTKYLLESLINTIDGIVWECDVNTFEFTFISKKVEDILGYTAEEWLSSKTFWKDHIYHEDRDYIVNFCSTRIVEKLDHDFEYRMVAKDGSIIWLRDIVTLVIKDNKVVRLRGIMIDITGTKKTEKDLKTSFNLVINQNERLLNFSHIVSHNLRSHSSNISSLIGLIEITENNEERKEIMGLLKSVSNSLNDTMIHLNEVVSIQTTVSLATEKINVHNYIETTLKVLSVQIKSSNATINNLVSNDVEIKYNPAYMESILYNIISNAIRYKHKEREPIITIKYYNENEFKVLEISDNGIGIDLEKNKDKVFGMYKTFTDNKDSKGIGLFITKNQVEAMGGNIIVESELNIGTIFRIYFL